MFYLMILIWGRTTRPRVPTTEPWKGGGSGLAPPRGDILDNKPPPTIWGGGMGMFGLWTSGYNQVMAIVSFFYIRVCFFTVYGFRVVLFKEFCFAFFPAKPYSSIPLFVTNMSVSVFPSVTFNTVISHFDLMIMGWGARTLHQSTFTFP